MAMRNNLNSPLKASCYKQVKRPNGKYGYMQLPSGISKCDICGKNFHRMKLFDHVRESHRQYFCIVCRARFKIHKDLISHIQDIHELVASEKLNKAQDVFSDFVHKRYFAQPLQVSQPPIPPTTNFRFSNSSSEDDELLLDNLDVLDIVLGTKNCDQRREEMEINDIINDIVNDVINDVEIDELFDSTFQDLKCSDIPITNYDNNIIKELENNSLHSLSQTNYENFPTNNLNNSETNDLCKFPISEDYKSSQILHNVEEKFKIEINSMSVLSERSPWVNGPDTLQTIDKSSKSDNDNLVTMALTLDHKLTDIKLNIIIKECIRTSCLTCVYCHSSTCIAVNGKQLALHMIEKHRFMTVKNESAEDVANILKSNLHNLENVYFNSENNR